jgi:hypothetical protein
LQLALQDGHQFAVLPLDGQEGSGVEEEGHPTLLRLVLGPRTVTARLAPGDGFADLPL